MVVGCVFRVDKNGKYLFDKNGDYIIDKRATETRMKAAFPGPTSKEKEAMNCLEKELRELEEQANPEYNATDQQ